MEACILHRNCSENCALKSLLWLMRTACYLRRERITPHSNGSVTMKRIIATLAVLGALLGAGAAAGAAAHASAANPAPYTLYRG